MHLASFRGHPVTPDDRTRPGTTLAHHPGIALVRDLHASAPFRIHLKLRKSGLHDHLMPAGLERLRHPQSDYRSSRWGNIRARARVSDARR